MSEKITTVDICIATFKRPSLLKNLLESIQLLDIDEKTGCRIIVVDNDKDGSAEKVVSKISCSSRFPIVYGVEPIQNIALARNRAMSLSNGQYVAFVDDDEYVHKDWVKEHIMSINQFKAQGAFGPVLPVYEEGVPPWIAKGEFFKRKRWPHGTTISLGGAGNSFFSREAVDKIGLTFNRALGLTGGEDTEFFSLLSASGSRLVWNDSAIVYEFVPRNRANVKWIIKRAFRGGQTYARIYVPVMISRLKVCWFFKRVVFLVGLTACALVGVFFGKIIFMKIIQKMVSNMGQVSYLSRKYYKEYETSVNQV